MLPRGVPDVARWLGLLVVVGLLGGLLDGICRWLRRAGGSRHRSTDGTGMETSLEFPE